MRYITHEGVKYRIRGPHTATDLRRFYQGMLDKHPGTKLTFRGFIVGYGKVYNRVKGAK